MKTESTGVQSMDDLVFENRNKEYGAYAIRKTYADNLNKALLFVFGVLVATVMLPLVLPLSSIDSLPTLPGRVFIVLKDEPTIVVEKVKQKSVAAIRKAVRDVAPVVTSSAETLAESQVREVVTGSDAGVEGGETPSAGDVSVGLEEVGMPAVTEEPKVWIIAEVMPHYNGGMEAMTKYLQKKLRYPPVARRTNAEGLVYVSFIVNTDGSVIQVKVIKGISKECDEEAVRVISAMPAWSAGRQGNIPVMVRMVLPIKFKLSY